MALDKTAIQAAAKAAVLDAMGAYATWDQKDITVLYGMIADATAAVVPAIIDAIVSSAAVAVPNVQAGSDTASGTIS